MSAWPEVRDKKPVAICGNMWQYVAICGNSEIQTPAILKGFISGCIIMSHMSFRTTSLGSWVLTGGASKTLSQEAPLYISIYFRICQVNWKKYRQKIAKNGAKKLRKKHEKTVLACFCYALLPLRIPPRIPPRIRPPASQLRSPSQGSRLSSPKHTEAPKQSEALDISPALSGFSVFLKSVQFLSCLQILLQHVSTFS